MHVALLMLFLALAIIFRTADKFIASYKIVAKKRNAVPTGVAIEYKIGVEKYQSYNDIINELDKEFKTEKSVFHAQESQDRITEIIRNEIYRYNPEIHAEFCRQGQRGMLLAEAWAVVYARLETVKQGRNPLMMGYKIPVPLPTGWKWAFSGKASPVNTRKFDQSLYEYHQRTDKRSEEELRRMQTSNY